SAMIFLQMVNSLPHYPVAQADAQTFPLSLILNEIECLSALTWRVDLGSARALACLLRRLAGMLWTESVRDGEGAIASTRGACAPQKKLQRRTTTYCSRKMIRAFVRS